LPTKTRAGKQEMQRRVRFIFKISLDFTVKDGNHKSLRRCEHSPMHTERFPIKWTHLIGKESPKSRILSCFPPPSGLSPEP
jgi:hypothetical protein